MPNQVNIYFLLIIGTLSLWGCATGASSEADEIRRIELKCGVKNGTLRLDDKVGFTFNPDPNEKYEKVDCALSELRASPLRRYMNYGFVGNEGPAQEEKK